MCLLAGKEGEGGRVSAGGDGTGFAAVQPHFQKERVLHREVEGIGTMVFVQGDLDFLGRGGWDNGEYRLIFEAVGFAWVQFDLAGNGAFGEAGVSENENAGRGKRGDRGSLRACSRSGPVLNPGDELKPKGKGDPNQ